MAGHREFVFAGAGHTTLVALERLAKDPPPASVSLTVVSRGDRSHYSGMMPGWIEGIYGDDAMAIPLEGVLRRANARLVTGTVVGADADALHLEDGQSVPYDGLIVNTGSVNRLPAPLRHERVISARPIAALVPRLSAPLRGARSFVVVGGGVAGVETAFALKARRPDAAVALVEKSPHVLPGFPPAFRRHVMRAFEAAGVTLAVGDEVVEVTADAVRLRSGLSLPGECILALTGAAPPPWLERTPFAKDADGFLATDAAMTSISHPNVLGAGDSATDVADPRPKAGVFAVRAGAPIARAVRALASGRPPPPAKLQRRGLVLLSTGHRNAVGTRNGLTLSGGWVWRLKDRFDTAFVRRFG